MIFPTDQLGQLPEEPKKFEIRTKLQSYMTDEITKEFGPHRAELFNSLILQAHNCLNNQHLANSNAEITIGMLLMLSDAIDFAAFFIAGADEEFLNHYASLQDKKFIVPTNWKPYL